MKRLKQQWMWVAALGAVALAAGAQENGTRGKLPGHEVAPGVRLIGRIESPRITESSGVVASRQYPGVFWTHTDGGGGRKQIFCAMTREGKTLAEILVVGVLIRDWEDIAIDDARHLYVGDIGNNDAKRSQLAVYQIDEPNPKSGGVARLKKQWQLLFPDKPFDCESLFVGQDHGYVVSKVFDDAQAEIYRFPLAEQTKPFTLEFVARLKVNSPVTGADLSPDGRRLGLVARAGAYVLRIDGDVSRAHGLKPERNKYRHDQIEGCCFVPEGLLATSEKREIYLFTDPPFRP